MMGMGGPSSASPEANECRSPCAWTRFSIPARRARRGSSARTYSEADEIARPTRDRGVDIGDALDLASVIAVDAGGEVTAQEAELVGIGAVHLRAVRCGQ